MSLIDSIFNNSTHIEFPGGVIGWLLWFLYLAGTLYLVWKGLKYHPRKPRIPFIWSGILVIGAVLASGFIGFSFSFGLELPLPGLPMQANGAAWMVLSALPWMFSAFTFGPMPSVGLAFISGLIISVWHDHSFFTPVIYALLAAVYSQLVNINYRSSSYDWLRRPFAAALVISVIYPFLNFLADILLYSVPLAARIEFAFAYLLEHSLAYGLATILGGVLILLILKRWENLSIITPGTKNRPMNMTLAGRMLMLWVPLMLVLLFTLTASTWHFGGQAAFERISVQMEKSGDVIDNQIPGFLQMGQNLISSAVKSETLKTSNDFQEMNLALEKLITDLSFFDQFFVLSLDGTVITGYPQQDFNMVPHNKQELDGIQLVSQGMGFQSYPVPAGEGSEVLDFAFIKPIMNSRGEAVRILVGRTQTINNLFSDPWLNELKLYSDMGGYAAVINDEGTVVYHSDPNSVGVEFPMNIETSEEVFNGIGSDGSRQLIYSSRIEGSAFKLIHAIPTSVPLQDVIQQISVITIILGLLAVLGFGILYVNMRVVNKQVEELVETVSRISDVNLDQEVDVRGFGEVGHLASAFENMRQSIREYLEDYQSKLSVSRKVASTFDLEKAMRPILERIVQFGAVSGRLAVQPGVLPSQLKAAHKGVGYGSMAESYAVLDAQVLAMNRHQERVFLTSPSRAKLQMPEGRSLPGSIAAVSLQKDGEFLGSLWVAYEMPHQFDELEIRTLTWIADHAAQALLNYRTYKYEKLWGDWLETIFDGWTSPVLFVDPNEVIMYANKAVDDRLNKGNTVIPEMRLVDLKVFDKTVDLFRSDISAKKVQQVEIPGYGSFVVHSYPLAAEVEPGGKAYVFQDVTDYLAQASQRLDLISVVSQYFRTPLSLIQGYTSMMDMFGPLNEQQTSYLNKINQSIQRLNKTVEDILDFSRIESGEGLRISQIDAVRMGDQTVKDFQILADHRQVDLEFIRPREEQIILNADEALVQQALYNLIDNAVKFNRANGKVSVSVINDGSRVKFLIRDTGVGIAEIDQQYIFDRDHQRNKRGINDRRASGLGLSMVKSIMNWHKGDVFVSSVLGESSEFTLVFPKKH